MCFAKVRTRSIVFSPQSTADLTAIFGALCFMCGGRCGSKLMRATPVLVVVISRLSIDAENTAAGGDTCKYLPTSNVAEHQ
jgi:hypothetical protein